MALSTSHPPSTTGFTWLGEQPIRYGPNGCQYCGGNGPFGGNWGPFGSSGPWTTGPWSTWWGQQGCPEPNWSGWTCGEWSTNAPWTTWTGCTATTTATTTYTTTVTDGSIVTSVMYGVQVAEQSDTVASMVPSVNEGVVGVTVAFGSLLMALFTAILVL